MMIEVWRPVPEFELLYEVSDFGNVRNAKTQKLISISKTAGYCSVTLRLDLGVWKSRYVHHLVLKAFLSPRPEGLDGCHKDGNKDNNALSNLKWDTKKNNMADRIAHGTASWSDRHAAFLARVMVDV